MLSRERHYDRPQLHGVLRVSYDFRSVTSYYFGLVTSVKIITRGLARKSNPTSLDLPLYGGGSSVSLVPVFISHLLVV